MIKFLRTFSERIRQKTRAFRPYRVHYEITFDGELLNRFNLVITAKSQEHAWDQIKAHIKIRPVKVEVKKDKA